MERDTHTNMFIRMDTNIREEDVEQEETKNQYYNTIILILLYI